MSQDSEALAILTRIEDAHAALRQMLKSVKPSRLYERPPSGEWSPMENVRHLIFAEQHHFGPHLKRGFRWSTTGVPPPNRKGERRLSPVGIYPGTPVDDVFDAWAKVHEVVRALAIEGRRNDEVEDREEGERTLTWRLEGNLKHVALHTRTIERLLRE